MKKARPIGVSGYRMKPSNGASQIEPGPATGPCELHDIPDGAPFGTCTAFNLTVSVALRDRGVFNACSACVSRWRKTHAIVFGRPPMEEEHVAKVRVIETKMQLGVAQRLARLLLEYVKERNCARIEVVDPEGNKLVIQLQEDPPRDGKVKGQIQPVESPPEGSGTL